MGEALGEECQAEGVGVILGPAVNIKRSPLCGRNFEYYSEDPYVASEIAGRADRRHTEQKRGHQHQAFSGEQPGAPQTVFLLRDR